MNQIQLKHLRICREQLIVVQAGLPAYLEAYKKLNDAISILEDLITQSTDYPHN